MQRCDHLRALSPTAAATRLIEPERTSPIAKIPSKAARNRP